MFTDWMKSPEQQGFHLYLNKGLEGEVITCVKNCSRDKPNREMPAALGHMATLATLTRVGLQIGVGVNGASAVREAGAAAVGKGQAEACVGVCLSAGDNSRDAEAGEAAERGSRRGPAPPALSPP